MKIQFIEHKGAKLGVFWDVNNAECSFQADVIQNHELLWLGVNVDTTGNAGFRMLLDKPRAALIIEIMKKFLETGKTLTAPEEMPETVKSKIIEEKKNEDEVNKS